MDRREKIGLVIATLGHVGLLGVLSLGIAHREEMTMPNEPISVMITDQVGLEALAPNPSAEAATAVAPEIDDVIEPQETPQERNEPVAKAEPQPTPPKPSVSAPKPKPKPTPKKPDPPKAKPRSEPKKSPPKSEPKKPRASRLGDDFLKGVTDTPSTSRSQQAPASRAGPAVVASLERELYRQVKPKWDPPTGADAEKLRTRVRVELDRNGAIIGTPRIVSTTGQTASNKAQVKLHQERAIRAVRLAAPFRFPDQYYDEWKEIEPVFYLGL